MPVAFVAASEKTGTTTSLTSTAAVAGHTFVLWLTSERSAGARTVSSIGSHTNVTWTKLINQTSGAIDVEIWYGVVAGGTSGTTGTITMSGNSPVLAWTCREFSGVLTAAQVDGTAVGASGTTSSGPGILNQPTTGTYTAGFGNDLILAAAGYANGTTPTANPGGFTNCTFVANSTTCGVQGNYIAGGVAGANSATWNIGASTLWSCCIGALKVLPAGTPTFAAGNAAFAGSIKTSRQKSFIGKIGAPLGVVAFGGTAWGTGSGAGQVAISSLTAATNDLIVVCLQTASVVKTVAWNSTNFTKPASPFPPQIMFLPVTSGGTFFLQVTIDNAVNWALTALVLSGINLTSPVFDFSTINSSGGTGTSASDSPLQVTGNEVLVGLVASQLTSFLSLSAGTWGNGWTGDQTSGVGNDVGIVQGHKVVFTGEASQVSVTGLTAPGSAWTIAHASFPMLIGSPFAADLIRGRIISAGLAAFSAVLIRGRIISAGLAAFAASITPVKSGKTQALVAGMAAFVGGITKQVNKVLGANTMQFDATVTKQTQKTLAATMAAFAGAIFRGRQIAASMAAFSATITKQVRIPLLATMALFSAAIMRGRILTASMQTFTATITRTTVKGSFDAGMALFSAVFTAVKSAKVTLTASMQTFSATITKLIGKIFNAS